MYYMWALVLGKRAVYVVVRVGCCSGKGFFRPLSVYAAATLCILLYALPVDYFWKEVLLPLPPHTAAALYVMLRDILYGVVVDYFGKGIFLPLCPCFPPVFLGKLYVLSGGCFWKEVIDSLSV
jgi:hypothetical protein